MQAYTTTVPIAGPRLAFGIPAQNLEVVSLGFGGHMKWAQEMR